jgi:hypothetical protein
MNKLIRFALQPVPELEKFDTSLRYTDILFGFVIRELFLRLQNWTLLDDAVKLHLLVGTTLVLGSWIGYRRSLYRSKYQVKFFNLPFFRFILDQLMLILYFRIAVLTDPSGKQAAGGSLTNATVKLIMYVFVLYVLWDLLGLWMTSAKSSGTERKFLYPVVDEEKMTDKKQQFNWIGFFITAASLGVVILLWSVVDCFPPRREYFAVVTLLLLYRWAKEVRTSCQVPQRA